MLELVDSPPPVELGAKGFMDWDAVVQSLKANPGVWGKVDDVARSTAAQIRLGRVRAFRPVTDFEVTQRRNPDLPVSRTTLYVKFVGDPSDV
jgi:hypothetical protein